MSLRASEIAAVVAELAPLVGARLESARAHAERLVTNSERHGRGRVDRPAPEGDRARVASEKRAPVP